MCAEAFLIDEALNIFLHNVGSAIIVGNNDTYKNNKNNGISYDDVVNRMIEQNKHKWLSPNILSKSRIDNKYYLKQNDTYGLAILGIEFTVNNCHERITPYIESFRKFIMKSSVYKLCSIDERFDSVNNGITRKHRLER